MSGLQQEQLTQSSGSVESPMEFPMGLINPPGREGRGLHLLNLCYVPSSISGNIYIYNLTFKMPE